jgi:long-subunit acyl-CoA synthetase (AMP-forming)
MMISGELHLLNSTGSARAIVPHRDLIVECISIAKPTYMVSVPALLNKVT